MDDGRREVHGVTLRAGAVSRPKIVRETDDKVIIEGPIDITLTPSSARHLAKTLYRLARRIDRRASGIKARSDETAQQAQPAGQEPVPSGDAPTPPEGPSS